MALSATLEGTSVPQREDRLWGRVAAWRTPVAVTWALLAASVGLWPLIRVATSILGRGNSFTDWLLVLLLLLLLPLPACAIARSPVPIGLLAGFGIGISFTVAAVTAGSIAGKPRVTPDLVAMWSLLVAVPTGASLVTSLAVKRWRGWFWPRIASTRLEEALTGRGARVAGLAVMLLGPASGAWLLVRSTLPPPPRPPWTGRALPAPRTAEGWGWQAHGVSASADREVISCRLEGPSGPIVNFEGTLATPVGTFAWTDRNSATNQDDAWPGCTSGSRLVSDIKSTELPHGPAALDMQLAAGFVPSDGGLRPINLPADWCHLSDTQHPGWVDPRILRTWAFRAWQSPSIQFSAGWSKEGSDSTGWILFHQRREVGVDGVLVTPFGSFERQCRGDGWLWVQASEVTSRDVAFDPLAHAPRWPPAPSEADPGWVLWADSNERRWTAPETLVPPRRALMAHDRDATLNPTWIEIDSGSTWLSTTRGLDFDPPELGSRPDLLLRRDRSGGTRLESSSYPARLTSPATPCDGPSACPGQGATRVPDFRDLQVGDRICIHSDRHRLVLARIKSVVAAPPALLLEWVRWERDRPTGTR